MQDDQVERCMVKLKFGTNPRIFGTSTEIKYSLRKLGTCSVMTSNGNGEKYQIHIWYSFDAVWNALLNFGSLYGNLV
jgi:hypothetical protein